MNDRLIIIGAGGHGRVLADLALKLGYRDIAFLDDRACGLCMGFPILGTTGQIRRFDDGNTGFVIGVGNNEIRKKIAEGCPVNWVSLIHPSAQIGAGVSIGPGTVVLAGAVINACADVGSHCVLNTGAIVEHDSVLGDYVHICPGAALGGSVRVGHLTQVGIGAAVRNNIRVCGGCVLGAGAVAVKDITVRGTYVGVPARKLV